MRSEAVKNIYNEMEEVEREANELQKKLNDAYLEKSKEDALDSLQVLIDNEAAEV